MHRHTILNWNIFVKLLSSVCILVSKVIILAFFKSSALKLMMNLSTVYTCSALTALSVLDNKVLMRIS